LNAFPPFNRSRACRHGTLLYNIHDMYVGRSLDLYGEFSEGEADLFRQMLRPGMTVVEVGANIGALTVVLAQAVWPGGTVRAFEPQRIVFQTLCANMALNNITNADCRQAAVGRAPGNLYVPPLDYSQTNNFGGLELSRTPQGERVSVVTLDSLNLPLCTLLKIDVEGMEQEVLEGARATIGRCQPVLYVENDRPEKSAALVRLIASLGYEMYWHRPPLFNPANFFGHATNVFDNIVSINMICCPRGGGHKLVGFPPVELPPG
jgi:FkbM family methyltransferase